MSRGERLFRKLYYLLLIILVFSILLQLIGELDPSQKVFGQSNGCDLVVDKGGSGDTKTITEALSKVAQGEKICVKQGLYHEAINLTKAGITLTAFDKSKKPIIDGDEDGSGNGFFELPKGEDHFVDGGRGYNYRELVSIENKDITFSYFIVKNSRGDGIGIASKSNPLTNIHVHDNEVSSAMVTNISIHGEGSPFGNDTTGTLIENNIFEYASMYHRYDNGNWPGSVCLAGANDMTMKNNVIRYSWGDGLLVDCNWQRSNNIVIDGNIIYDTEVSMLYVHAADNITVKNNFVFTTPTNPTQETPNWACLHLQAQENESYRRGGVHGISGARIFNNIFWGCRVMMGLSTQAEGSYLRDVEIFNNTFVSNGSVSGSWPANAQFTDMSIQTQAEGLLGKAESVTIANNLFAHALEEDQIPIYINGSSQGVTFTNNYWSVKPTTVDVKNDIGGGEHGLKGKDGTGKFPIFEKAPSIDDIKGAYKWFELKESSPAIDKGSSSYDPQIDFYSNNRNNPIDIGALEYGSTRDGDPDNPPDPKDPPEESKKHYYDRDNKICSEETNDPDTGLQCDKRKDGILLKTGWNFISIAPDLKEIDTDWLRNQLGQNNSPSLLKVSKWENNTQSYDNVVYSDEGIFGFPIIFEDLDPLFVFVENDISLTDFYYPKGESTHSNDLTKGWNTLVLDQEGKTGLSKASDLANKYIPDLIDSSISKIYISNFRKSSQSWETYISDGNKYGTDFNVFAEEPYLVYVE